MLHKEEGIHVPGRRVAAIRKAGVLIAGLALFSMAPAYGAFTCEGKVTYLGMNSEGLVTVSVGGFGIWYICSQTSSFAGNGGITYSPEGCRAWFATFLAAQKSGSTIRFFFNTPANTSNGPECTALGSWAYPSPAPYHMNSMD
jgi:hypothetical protein